MGEKEWPLRPVRDCRIIDWSWNADEVANFVNDSEAPLALTFLWGSKVAFAGAVASREDSGIVPGTLIEPGNGPVTVAANGGVVTFESCAVEQDKEGEWICRDRLGDFLELFQDLRERHGIVFNNDRFEDFEKVLAWCQVKYTYHSRRDAKNGIASEIRFDEGLLRDARPWARKHREWFAGLAARVGLKPGARVLDVGCENLWLPRMVHEMGYEAWGCDVFPPEAYEPFADWLHYFHADLDDFPKLPCDFDLIVIRGMTPLIYVKHLQSPKLAHFRDTLIGGLGEGGAIFLMQQGKNTGAPRTIDDWGNCTIEQLHEWLGAHLPYRAYGRTIYTSVLASRQPLSDLWREEDLCGIRGDALSDAEAEAQWAEYHQWMLDPVSLRLLFMRLSQKFWERDVVKTGGKVFVLGSGELAKEFALTIKEMREALESLGCGEKLPDDLPEDTFVYCLPGFGAEDCRDHPHALISWQELLGRAATKDIYSVAQDHDTLFAKKINQRQINNIQRALDALRKRAAAAGVK